MDVTAYRTYHLVKGEDLNHHGTLYAGRSAEWFVEAGFIAAAAMTSPEKIVCLKIHGMVFTRPIHLGEVIFFESRIILTGKSRLIANVKMYASSQQVVDGFITFVNVDKEGHALPHGIVVIPASPEDISLQERAKNLAE